jgi:AraC-like DNA-binding protein
VEIIARELGFSSGFHLSKAFKKIVGMPPKDFRRQYHRH